MAIKITQTGRSLNTVTFNISGIENDRRIMVWIPEKGEYVTLANAVVQEYINGFESESVTDGEIKLKFSGSIARDFPVWEIIVQNCHTENGNTTVLNHSWAVLCTKFNYDNGSPKIKGEPIDLTADDMNRLSLFAKQLEKAYSGCVDDEDYYKVESGDAILYKHVRAIASGIKRGPGGWAGFWTDEDRAYEIRNQLNEIINATNKSGAPVEAETFNILRDAINDLNYNADIEKPKL